MSTLQNGNSDMKLFLDEKEEEKREREMEEEKGDATLRVELSFLCPMVQ